MVSEHTVAGIGEIVESVAEAYFGMSAQRCDKAAAGNDWWTGCVSIHGPWRGSVAVACSRDFATRAAAAMAGTTRDKVSDDDARDAIGELTNILGGNFKALIALEQGATHSLSLPIVAAGPMSIAGATVAHDFWFKLGGESLRVSVLEQVRSEGAIG